MPLANFRGHRLPDANVPDTLKDWQSTYARDWSFLATDEPLSLEGKPVHGLNLPQPVLRKKDRSKTSSVGFQGCDAPRGDSIQPAHALIFDVYLIFDI